MPSKERFVNLSDAKEFNPSGYSNEIKITTCAPPTPCRVPVPCRPRPIPPPCTSCRYTEPSCRFGKIGAIKEKTKWTK